MIQLSYQPAFDPTHAIFRILRIKDYLSLLSVEYDKLRILDYYVVFPSQATGIRLQKGDMWIRTSARRFEDKQGYARLPSREILFERMKIPQVSALQTMAASGAVDPEAMRNGTVTFLRFELPSDLMSRVKRANEREDDAMKIVKALQRYPLLGKDGLKDRTGLLEYRYDQI